VTTRAIPLRRIIEYRETARLLPGERNLSLHGVFDKRLLLRFLYLACVALTSGIHNALPT